MSTIGEAGPRGVRGWLAGTTFRSLRHRNYRLYFSGQVVSLTGSWMQTTALMWLAWELTHDPGWPPFIMAANLFPACLLGAWGGWLADHFPKRDLVLASQSAFFTLALGLTLLYFGGAVTPWLLFALVLGQGTVMAFDLPARLALVPNLVPRED
ncbi:MAG TPA: MFS transporter, partial [Gemmataceae bacterium]